MCKLSFQALVIDQIILSLSHKKWWKGMMKQSTVPSSQCHLVSLQANSQCHSINTASYRYFQFIVEVWFIFTKNWKRNTELIILLNCYLYKDKKKYKTSNFKFSFQLWHSQGRASQYIPIVIPTRCTNFSNLFYFWNNTLHVLDGLSIHHQKIKTIHKATGYNPPSSSVALHVLIPRNPNVLSSGPLIL
jgi:hypothetical protein